MKLRTLASLFVGSAMFLAAAPASAQAADTSKVMGLRLEANLTRDFNVFQGASSPQGDIRIGYDLPMGLTPMIGFGLQSRSFEAFDDRDRSEGSTGVTDIVIAAELRYYFSPHKRGLQPFVFGEFNTTIASFGTEEGETDDTKLTPVQKDFVDARDKARGDENSFVNLNAGLGMEYKFAKSFGIGAKWGVGLNLRGTSIQKVNDAEAGDNTSNSTFGTSSAFYAAFRI